VKVILPVLMLMVSAAILGISLVGCSNTPTENGSEEVTEFADAFLSYALEVKLADEIATERLNKASDLLGKGEINTFEFRKRCYQVTLIHAYTLDYIDKKPQYEILWPFLYDKDEPPNLGWCIPELEQDAEAREAQYESYLRDYIGFHTYALSEAVKKIEPPKSK